MHRKNLVDFRWSLVAPLLGLLAACGGGSDSGGTDSAPPPVISTVSPDEIVRTIPTNLDIAGTHLPTSGLSVTVPGDAKAACQAPSGLNAGGFKVACLFNRLGMQTLEIRRAGKLIGTVPVTVKTNVTGVSWISPSTADSGSVKFSETVAFKVAGVNLLADDALGFSVEKCDAPTEAGTPGNTLRIFSCTFTYQDGAVAGRMPGVVKDAPGGQVLLDGWKVPVEVALLGKLTDTGITASQCYAAGKTTWVNCTSAAAMALNSKQDGMIGRDVSLDSSDGKLGFSYSTVGSYAKTECVKDNITGLTWEGKPTSGLRAASNTYTHYDNTAAAQVWDGSDGFSPVTPTQAQIDAATNTVSYVNAVNASALCGYTDWRLPTADELQGIVDYGVAYPGPTIDGTWFPNTQRNLYWTGTEFPGLFSNAWGVHFYSGHVDAESLRSDHNAVRLVR